MSGGSIDTLYILKACGEMMNDRKPATLTSMVTL
jgi:hypothetical protein